MRSYFLMIIIIANPLSAIIDSSKQPITKDITIGPPPGMGRHIRQAQAQGFLDGTLKYQNDRDCFDKTIGVCTLACVSLALYATLTKMSMSIY